MCVPPVNSRPEAAGAGLGAVVGPGCASKHVAMVAAAKSSKELGPPVPRQRRAKCCAGLRAAPRSPMCQAGENPPSRAESLGDSSQRL